MNTMPKFIAVKIYRVSGVRVGWGLGLAILELG